MGKKKPLPPDCVERNKRYYCPCGIPFSRKKDIWEHWTDWHSPEGIERHDKILKERGIRVPGKRIIVKTVLDELIEALEAYLMAQ